MRFSVQTASLRQLVLLSFFLALIPVGVLLWQSNKSLSGVSNYAIASAEQAVSSVRQAESMQSLVVDIERAVRQFAVVRTDALQRLALNHIDNQLQLLEQLCRDLPDLALCGAQRSALQGLRARFNEPLTEVPEALLQQVRTQQQQITKEIWDLLEQQLDRQQQQVTSTQQQLAWETFALVMLTLLLVLWASGRIAAPVQKLDRMIRAIAQPKHQFPDEKLRGPRELTELGEQLRWLSSRLQQLEALRLILLRHASHELKTPLAVLQAQIEAMQDGIRKATPEHLDAMMRQVSSLKKLTQDLADLAQAEAMQLKFYLAPINPWQVIEQEVENFRPKFEQAELSVRLEGEAVPLQLDIDRFKQIMVNLIANSIRYTEAGGQVHIHSEQTATEWSVYVDDSPFGLTDEQLARLGERFYRVDDSRTRSTGGTGLGLALSAKIAQAMGGQLSFAHSPLGGLRCKLTFPIPTKQ